jgi:hypothetical protein
MSTALVAADHAKRSDHTIVKAVLIQGSNWGGGISDRLQRVIRKAGDYELQWKNRRLESGVVSFRVLPERTEPGGATNQNQPVRAETNRMPAAAGSGR